MSTTQSGQLIKTEVFRASYAHIFQPTNLPGQDNKYCVTMLFDKQKDKAAINALQKAAQDVVTAKWPDPAKRPTIAHPFRDGDKEMADKDGYAGMMFIKASTKRMPPVFDEMGNPVTDPEKIYSGCYCKALVQAYVYTKPKTGVTFSLQGIQFIKDGDPFDGRPSRETVANHFGQEVENADQGFASEAAEGEEAPSEVSQDQAEGMFK